uniref:GDSL-type esterase/lipase family protein n=1 Tax=Candidatus Stercorousia sp. TaxID=3048886 RepID=UPI0040289DFB
MKKILCFGDSNTFGYNPNNGSRYNENSRWTGILKNLCKNNYEIIEAGCNNRTAFSNNPDGIQFTGYMILPEYLKKFYDIIILAIGINDLQKFYNPTLEEFETGIENLIKKIRESLPNCNIIILSPSHITENILNSNFRFMFDQTSIRKSKQITPIYEKIANEYNCKFLDLNKIVIPSEIDGLHYEVEEHKKIAQSIITLL